MVPDTFIGVLLAIALLAPGFVYLEARERRHPGVDYSALRETSLVVVTSLASLTVSLGAFALMRIFAPSHSPDIGAYVRDGSLHVKAHYMEAAVWGFGVLILACLVAALVAVPPDWVGRAALRMPRYGNQWALWVTRRRGPGPIVAQSGWRVAFNALPKTERWIDAVLIDGTSVHGRVGSSSTQLEETQDRDLVLVAPITVRPNGAADWTPLQLAGTLVVSAARISYFTVQYVGKPTPADEGPTPEGGEPTKQVEAP